MFGQIEIRKKVQKPKRNLYSNLEVHQFFATQTTLHKLEVQAKHQAIPRATAD